MPIAPTVIDDIDLLTTAPQGKATDDPSPKFFSSKLTGSGGKVGLLNQNLLPINTVNNTAYAKHQNIEIKQSTTQYDITTTTVPLAPLSRRTLEGISGITFPLPEVDDRFELALTNPASVAYFDMTPQGLTLYEDKSGGASKRDLIIQYRMEFYLQDVSSASGATTTTVEVTLPQHKSSLSSRGDHVWFEWSISPMEQAKDFITDMLAVANTSATNLDDLDDWLRNYSVADRITRLAGIWSSDDIADEVIRLIDPVSRSLNPNEMNSLALQLRYLENYNVTLEAYKAIHTCIEASFGIDHTAELSKQNLNLLMNQTLNHLERIKPQLNTPAVPATAPVLPAHLSKQQLSALTTHEPLVMTQAGAGTGKSTVILQRIKYLESCGVPASDITVLSFTNAAADNITEKNPKVGSMTIAKMIIDIYAMNHPTHKISAIDTIINSLDIFYPNDQMATAFRQRLLEVDQNKVGAFTALNTFVERNYDGVIMLLDRIQQTSLELQIMICYQRIDQMNEPAHVRSKYLIIDEVQDNSIFEFIYLLKYVTKHQESLFIVGDASQTLYEFRSANPRALNTLEQSGVFATYRLTTNYRSNQEILDFANVVLNGLETNKFANIQLKANALAVPTADSFTEKVTLNYHEVPRLLGFVGNDLPLVLQNTVCPDYVDDCLDRGEQVAFLAYSRREVNAIQAVLTKKYPNKRVASLVSDRVYATDIFSKYIKFFWNDVLQTQPNNAAFAVAQGIKNNMAKLTKNAANPEVEKAILNTVSEWWLANQPTVVSWVGLTQQGTLSHKEFFERLRDCLLNFEIQRNQQKLNVNKQRNRARKQENMQSRSDLVVSTIHGAKGLEFDNVVVLYKEDARMSQDSRRMFYVAFTRAMKSQYVLAYGTMRNPAIQANYEQLVNALTERDKRNTLIAQGVDPDDLGDDLDGGPVGPASPVGN